MAKRDCTQPGHCFVKQISVTEQGVRLKPGWLQEIGWDPGASLYLIARPQGLLISPPHPLLDAALELQLRQDEARQDFSQAIGWLIQGVGQEIDQG